MSGHVLAKNFSFSISASRHVGVREFGSSYDGEFWSSGDGEFVNLGVQKMGSSGVQGMRSS